MMISLSVYGSIAVAVFILMLVGFLSANVRREEIPAILGIILTAAVFWPLLLLFAAYNTEKLL